MSKIELEMEEYLPLREVVFHSLRRAILEGTLEPGERLMEIHLAQELGVSRTPVREAIRQLEQEGLVVTYPRRGAVVAKITRKDLEDVLEVRAALEALAVRKAAVLMNITQLQQLKKAQQQFIICLRQNDLAKSANADAQFHQIITDATSNDRLISLLNNVRGQMYRFRLENIKDQQSHDHLLEHHARLYTAMETHDPDLAERTIREHIELQRRSILASLHM